MDAKIALRAADLHAMTANDFIIRAEKKMHLLARVIEFGAVKTADGAAANDRDFQARTECRSESELRG